MFTTRRQFLGIGASGLSFVSLGGFVPRLLADAAEESAAAAKNDRALVVVELTGGNDGLNTLIPFENDLYYQRRRVLGIPKANVHKLADGVGLHPSMEAVAELYKQGQLGVVQGIGYPQPDRSHFRSMEIWHTASIEKRPPTTGWLGRFVDLAPGKEADLPGLALTGSAPQAFQSERAVVPVVSELAAIVGDENSPDFAIRRKLSAGSSQSKGPLDFIRKQSAAVYRTAERLKQATTKYQSKVEYPGSPLANQFKQAAQYLAGDLGVRVVYLSQDGYDTHSAQAESHANLLGDLSNSIAAFQKDLQGLGIADRTLVLVFSEFGRRVEENASAGTDHGAASCLFVVGAKLKGGLFGQYPALNKLDDGDLIFNTDFRSVYATLLGDWLSCPAEKVLGEKFPQVPLLG